MSQDAEYPFPNYINPLKGVTDIKMVEYWLQHGIVDKRFKYSRQNTHGRIDLSPLHQYAETVDILFATYKIGYEFGGEYTPQVCHTLTFDDMMQLYQFSQRYYFNFTSFHYTLPNGDIYYSIVEILKNIKEDEIDMYIEKYSKQCPPIFVLLSTLPYERSKELVDNIRSIQDALSMTLYDDYLICSAAFNTFDTDIYCMFNKANPEENQSYIFFRSAARHSPSAIQYMIDGDPRFYVDDWDREIILSLSGYSMSKLCLDMVLASNQCYSQSGLLLEYLKLDDINTVKSLLRYNTTTSPIVSSNDLLGYAKSAEMVHFLVSWKAPLHSSRLARSICYSSLDVIKALLYHKASLECDEDGRHPLHAIGAAQPDILDFMVPFLSSSISGISMHVKTNNTTGLPDDIYNYIKSSLSNVDINICDKFGYTALLDALNCGIHVPYLLENNASPHLYTQGNKLQKVFNTYDDALSFLDNHCASHRPYRHYIDNALIEGDQSKSRLLIYHNIYNLMKYKAYPLTYVSDVVISSINNTATNDIVYYSHLTRSIVNRHRDFIILLLGYLSPVNMPFRSSRKFFNDIPAMYPLETALYGDSPNKDIVYELIQYGAIYPPASHNSTTTNNNNNNHDNKNKHLPCTIKNLLIDYNR